MTKRASSGSDKEYILIFRGYIHYCIAWKTLAMMAINIDVEGRHTFYLKVPLRREDVTGYDIDRSFKIF